MNEPLPTLLKRIEIATGPDRALDAEIARACGILKPYVDAMSGHGALHGYEYRGERRAFTASWWAYDRQREWPPSAETIVEQIPSIPCYTASVDQAIGLLEELLPGWWWSCGFCQLSNDGSVYVGPIGAAGPDFRANAEMAALVDDRKFDQGFHGDRRGGNVPLAILSAMLQGLIALQEKQRVRVEVESPDAPPQEPAD